LRGVKDGVLTQVFGGPVAKVLDQSVYVGGMEQTIPMLAESTGLSFKTAQKAVLKLNKLGLVKQSRRIGNTQTYRFDVRNDLHELIDWAEKLKISRLRPVKGERRKVEQNWLRRCGRRFTTGRATASTL
jgi:DNA-binding transcriptional regulator YhcF (GntR family)